MENTPLVSVIVPVYNVRDYLEECLDSIVGQSYTKLEIILVDDGATDGSSEICDAYATKDDRIKVIHQENKGAAAARKKAVLYVTGDYVCFVDADDIVDRQMIDFFIENIGSCDLITSGCKSEDAPGIYQERVDAFEAGIYDTEDAMKYFIANMIVFHDRFEDGILPFLINKMYRAEIMKIVIQDIDTSITYAEDRDLLFRYVLQSKAVKVTHEIFYDYRYRAESIMRTVNETFMRDLNALYFSLREVFELHPQRESLVHQLQLFITSRIYFVTRYMGFPVETGIMTYVFPFTDLDRDSKIVLYGAGRVGVEYYRQIYRRKLVNMILWVDKNWENYKDSYMPVFAPENIKDCEYDYLIIAVKKKELAAEIRKELILHGVEENKVLWRVPAIL